MPPTRGVSIDANVHESNAIFRRLISIQAYVSFLGDICVASGYAHTRTAVGILGVLNNPEESETVTHLGALQRVIFWEHIMLKAHAPKSWASPSTSTVLTMPTAAPDIVSIPVGSLAPAGDSRFGGDPCKYLCCICLLLNHTHLVTFTDNVAPSETTVEGIAATIVEATASTVGKSVDSIASASNDPLLENAKALKSVASGLSQALTPLFSGILSRLLSLHFHFTDWSLPIPAVIKLLTSRRNHDTTLRKQAMATAETLAQILLGHLVWPGAGMYDLTHAQI